MEPSERRPDEDIEEEIGTLIRTYPPLKASRPYFTFQARNGHVKLTGNVLSPQARQVLCDNVPRIQGVKGCDCSELYDDEMVRFAVGQILPPGVVVSVRYGTVALTGQLPDGAKPEVIQAAAAKVPGVRRVGAEFWTSTPNPK